MFVLLHRDLRRKSAPDTRKTICSKELPLWKKCRIFAPGYAMSNTDDKPLQT